MFKDSLLSIAYFVSTGIVLRILGCMLPSYVVEYYTSTANLLLWIVVTYFTLLFVRKKFLGGKVQPENKAVLITGCDTGFGHFLAKRLDSIGYQVFASCLFPYGDGAEELRRSCSEKIHVIGLDVTSDESVKDAVNYVQENLNTSKFWALVNNAGIFRGFSAEFTPMQDYAIATNVNTFGMVRVTKAFLPLIRKFRGRIVNVTSLSGRNCLPYLTPYTMSKHATVAFNDCLRREMEPWGVRVISVEPEMYKTAFSNPSFLAKHWEETLEKLSDDIKADYGEEYLQNFYSVPAMFTNWGTVKIQTVIDALESAIISEHPDIRYKPTRNIFMAQFIVACECFPAGIIDIIFKVLCQFFKVPSPKKTSKAL